MSLRLLVIASALAGCTADPGSIEFTIGTNTSHVRALPLRQDVVTPTIVITSDKDQGTWLTVAVPATPGTYDCTTARIIVTRDMAGVSDESVADMLTAGSSCDLTWHVGGARDIGDFSAHAIAIAHTADFLDVSGHFDVAAP